MKKSFAALFLVIVLALLVSACGGSSEPQVPAPTDVVVEEQVQEEPADQEPTEPPAAEEADPDSPAAIFAAALEGKEPDVERFFEGVPVPEDATIQILEDYRVEFVSGMDVTTSSQWYRDTFTGLGLIEVEGLGFESENAATSYWAGYPDGRAIKVFVRKLSSASSEVKVVFEDL